MKQRRWSLSIYDGTLLRVIWVKLEERGMQVTRGKKKQHPLHLQMAYTDTTDRAIESVFGICQIALKIVCTVHSGQSGQGAISLCKTD